MSDIKPTVPPMPTTPTTAVVPTMVKLAPALVSSPDGGQTWNVASMQVPEQGQRAMSNCIAAAHGAGLTPKQAAKQAATLYRAMLADALLECGIDSPVLYRAAGRPAK